MIGRRWIMAGVFQITEGFLLKRAYYLIVVVYFSFYCTVNNIGLHKQVKCIWRVRSQEFNHQQFMFGEVNELK